MCHENWWSTIIRVNCFKFRGLCHRIIQFVVTRWQWAASLCCLATDNFPVNQKDLAGFLTACSYCPESIFYGENELNQLLWRNLVQENVMFQLKKKQKPLW